MLLLKGISFLLIILATSLANSKTIRVAVIDSGFNENSAINVKRCPELDRDFTESGYEDKYNHGTPVTAIITNGLENVDYCIAILKAFEPRTTWRSGENTIKAFEYALSVGFDIINYSGGGDIAIAREKKYVKDLLDTGVQIIVAAGNNGKDLRKECNFYPACYDRRIIVVASKDKKGKIYKGSNFDSFKYEPKSNQCNNPDSKIVDYYVLGVGVPVQIDEEYIWYRTGTSFAAPQITRHIIKKMHEKAKLKRKPYETFEMDN